MWYLVCTLNISKKRWLFYELLLPGILAFCIGLFYLKSKEINILCKFIHKTKLITLDTLIVWTGPQQEIVSLFLYFAIGGFLEDNFHIGLLLRQDSGTCSWCFVSVPVPDSVRINLYNLHSAAKQTSHCRASNKGSRRFHNLYPTSTFTFKTLLKLYWCLKCESPSRRFQPEEGPS